MQDAALIISIVALLVACVALYVRGLQGATIGFQAGSTIGFCRTDDGFELYDRRPSLTPRNAWES